MDQPRPALGVGMVGYAFMGAAHSQAWRTAPHVFDLPLRPVLAVLCGRDRRPRGPPRSATASPAWRPTGAPCWTATTCSSSTCARPVIRTPRSPSPRWTRASTCCARSHWPTPWPRRRRWPRRRQRAQARGAAAMVGFNYRRVPAIALARQLVADGRIGAIRHVRASYLQDWLADPAFPLTWRLQREHAGSGALGDLGSHIVNLAQHLTGQLITGVSAASTTFITERQLAVGSAGPHRGRHRGRRGHVHRPAWPRDAGRVRGDPVRGRPEERAAHRAERRPRQSRVRPGAAERAGVLRPGRGQRDGRVPAGPGHRARPPVPVGLVAARARAGLGAHVRAPGRGIWSRPSRRARTRRPRSPTACRCSGCWPRSRTAPPKTVSGPRSPRPGLAVRRVRSR